MRIIHFFLLSVTCAAVVSCATSKKARQSLQQKTAETAQADVRAEARQTTESESQTAAEASKSESEDRRIIDLEFDTEKPVDPVTGTPPLKRATVTDTKRNSRREARQQTATAAKQQTEITVQDSTQKRVTQETVAERQTEKKSRSLWWLWLIAAAAAALGVRWLWRRYR